MSQLGGIAMILIGAWWIASRNKPINNSLNPWSRPLPVVPTTAIILKVVAGIFCIVQGISMVAGHPLMPLWLPTKPEIPDPSLILWHYVRSFSQVHTRLSSRHTPRRRLRNQAALAASSPIKHMQQFPETTRPHFHAPPVPQYNFVATPFR
jgi:hypothetical protein